MKPSISIITVCYNAEKTIRDTIQSVLNQDLQNIEYLIIDGASTDSTNDIIKSFEGDINVHISEKDKGLYNAINKGIQIAKADIIGILNADDFYIDKSVLSNVVETMNVESTDSLYADLNYVEFENTNKVVRKWVSGKFNRKKFLYGWMPPHPTFFVKKSVYERFGKFNEDFSLAADYELMLRFLFKHQVSCSYLARPIVSMRVGGLSNASLKNRIKANRQDRLAWKINGLKPYWYTLAAKPLRKVKQFF